MADVFANTEVAENKVVELATSPDAAARSLSELFSAIPEDGRRKAYAEAIAKSKAEEAMQAAEKAFEEAEKEVKKLEPQTTATTTTNLTENIQERATTAQKSFTNLMDRLKTATKPTTEPEPEPEPEVAAPGLALQWQKLSSGFASAVKNNQIELTKARIATIRGQAKARNLAPKQAVVKKPTAKKVPPVQPKPKESKAEVRKIFGGVFQQETIYVDD